VCMWCVSVRCFGEQWLDAEDERKNPMKFTGTIAKVDWMNPHVYVYVDTKNADGKVIRYSIEGGAPNALFRQGVRKEAIKIGDTVTVDGFLSKKEGVNYVNGSVKTQDGKSIFSAPTGGGAPYQN